MIYQMNRQFVFNVLFVASLWLSFNFQGPLLVLPPSLTVSRERGRNYILPHPLEFVNTFFEVFSTFFVDSLPVFLSRFVLYPVSPEHSNILPYLPSIVNTFFHLFQGFGGMHKTHFSHNVITWWFWQISPATNVIQHRPAFSYTF